MKHIRDQGTQSHQRRSASGPPSHALPNPPPGTRPIPKRWVGYSAAVLGSVLAAFFRWWLGLMFGQTLSPFITFYPVVVVAAIIGGVGPGLLATVLTALAVDILFLAPAGLGLDRPVDMVGITLFCAINLTLSFVAGGLRQAHRAIRTSETRYRRLFEAAHDGVLLLDTQTHKITDANPYITQLLGYPRQELLGKELWQIGLLKDANASRAAFDQLTREGHIRYEDLPLQAKTGETREVEFVSNLDEDNGRSVIQCNIRDITQRKQAEAALRDSELRFRTMADAIPNLAWIAKPDGWIYWYNRRWYEYTGTTPEQMEGWGWQSVHDPQTLPAVMERWQGSINTGQPFDMVFPLRGADGVFRPFLTRVIPLKDPAGRVVQWFGTNTDITEEKRAQQELQQARDQAQRQAREADERGRILDAMMDNIPMGITIAEGPDVRIQAVSCYGRELIGQSRPQLEGIPVDQHVERWRIFRKDGVTAATNEELPLTRATQKGEIVREEEFVIARPDGTRVPILCTAAPIRDREGNITGGVIGWQDITERKQAELALQAAKDRIETILASITDSFFALDRELRFTYVNPEAQRVLRKTSAELLGGCLADVFAHAEAFLAHYERVLATEKPAHFEEFYAPLHIWFEVHAYPSAEGISVYFRDVTQRRQAEEALRASEHFNRSLIESSLDCIKTLDLDGKLLSMSAGGQQLLEIGDLAPYLNASWIDLWKEADRPRVRQAVAAARNGRTGRFQAFCPTAAGAPKWWDVIVSPIRDPHGHIGSLLSVSRDITEQKEAESKLAALHDQLSAELAAMNRLHQLATRFLGQEELHMLLDGTLDAAIAVVGAAKGNIQLVAPHSGELAIAAQRGFDPAYIEFFSHIRAGQVACGTALQTKHRVVLEDITLSPLFLAQPEALRLKTGAGVRALVCTPLLTRANDLLGVLSVHFPEPHRPSERDLRLLDLLARLAADFIERTQTDQALRSAREDLARSNADLEHLVQQRTAKLRETVAELEGFSYSLVHDLRAPLRAMQSYAGIVEEEAGSRLQCEHIELLRKIRTATGRMDQLVTDSLNYTHILRENLALGPVNLGALLRGMLDTYPNLRPPQADITVELGDLLVYSNQAALTQIFSNLLGNAVKFVAPGVQPVVRVWAEKKDAETGRHGDAENVSASSVRIWVQDNGIGIPQDQHDKIFGMFQRMHRAEEYPGTGIGLALVKKSLERTGGHITVQSEPGRGSTFCVELPLLRGPTP